MNFKQFPQLSRRMFEWHSSGNYQMIGHNEVVDDDGKPRPGWTIKGWCPNQFLSKSRSDKLAAGGEWVGVLYEYEDGRLCWFHRIHCEDANLWSKK